MTKYQCGSCGGVYVSPQDGSDYFHVCPLGVDNPRNENIVTDHRGVKIGIVSEGRGRREKA